ncbi:glycosyltransferase family 4 protein [Streptomyces sp. NPDC047046]|uniref:glycosyltransferase family 4 protein n=1 Tax=Streptomyces sp. NPDC047046 TaxID=3155378 RepID=UPI0033E8E409
MSSPSSASSRAGHPPLRTVQVLGGGSAGSSAHVRSLAAGLAARGVRVTVCAPHPLETAYDFTSVGARHIHVPRSGDPVSLAALRTVCADADLVHAHGLHAGLRTALALAGRRVPLVVTWHTRGHAEGTRAHALRLLERRVARAATVLLATSSDLVDRARARGARDARLAPVALPPPPPAHAPAAQKTRADIGAVERPLVLAAGSLVPHRGYGALLDAARAWRALDPVPLLAVAGEGPLRGELQARIEAEDLPVRLLGGRDDLPALLAATDVAVLPSRWEARALFAQEALSLGVPLVASAVGAIPELVGDAAELVPYGDVPALAARVAALLADPVRRAELGRAGRRQAAGWPTEDATVAQVLSVYDELTHPEPLF